MMVKAVVFDGKKGIFDVGGEGVKTDRSAVFVLIDLKKQLTVSVQNLGGEFLGSFFKLVGRRQADEDLDIKVVGPAKDKKNKEDEAEGREAPWSSFDGGLRFGRSLLFGWLV